MAGGEVPSETCERSGGAGRSGSPQMFFKDFALRVSILSAQKIANYS